MERQALLIVAAIVVAGIAAWVAGGLMATECPRSDGLGRALDDRNNCEFNWKVGAVSAIAFWSGLAAIAASWRLRLDYPPALLIVAAIAVAGITAGWATGLIAPQCPLSYGLGQRYNCGDFSWRVGATTTIAVWSGLAVIAASWKLRLDHPPV